MYLSFPKNRNVNRVRLLLTPKIVGKAKGNGWKISPFSFTFKKGMDNLAMRAGDLCRFFHREREGFLSIRYNDTEFRLHPPQNDDEIVVDKTPSDDFFDNFLINTPPQDLYLTYLRLSNTVRKSKDVHTGQSIFKLELEKQNDGGLIKWNRDIRLKHMATAQYLAVVQKEEGFGDCKIILVDNYNDSNTIFYLEPLPSDNL
jgi:hypothetical protein